MKPTPNMSSSYRDKHWRHPDRVPVPAKNHKAKYGSYGSVGGFISKADPEAMEDPFGRGGGFVPETEPSGIIELGEM
ncbi:hypothetical protein Tco_1023071 [Tanacetum coccineum]